MIILYISIMIDLTEFDNRTSSKFIVRDVVDASGDYSYQKYTEIYNWFIFWGEGL